MPAIATISAAPIVTRRATIISSDPRTGTSLIAVTVSPTMLASLNNTVSTLTPDGRARSGTQRKLKVIRRDPKSGLVVAVACLRTHVAHAVMVAFAEHVAAAPSAVALAA
jgi:hypothetical protein